MTISRSLPVVFLVVIAAVAPSQSRAEDAPRLTKDQGPFLVLAYTFRGAGAEIQANALANELKTGHKLDAYTYENPEEKEEFHVYLGGCQTTKASLELVKKIKKIDAKSVPEWANPARKGSGLSRAKTAKNPLAGPK